MILASNLISNVASLSFPFHLKCSNGLSPLSTPIPHFTPSNASTVTTHGETLVPDPLL